MPTAPVDFPPPVDSAKEFVGRPTDPEDERIEVGVVIVGGGPAGLACAIRLTQLLEAEPELASYWIFGFVRNPWSRLVSWWSMVERFAELADQGVAAAQSRLDRNEFLRTSREYPDFETFLRRGPEELGRLRTPQLDYLTADGREVDFLGRTESLKKDLQTVFGHLGLDFPTELPHRNRSPHAHYTTYYSDASRQRVAELFAADIDAFGYEFGPRPSD